LRPVNRSDEGSKPTATAADVDLVGEDGREYRCRVLALFTFDGRDYAVLEKDVGTVVPQADESRLVIMHFVAVAGGTIFRTIVSDEEFGRVVDHVKAWVAGRVDLQ
jgi:hypothetical protein